MYVQTKKLLLHEVISIVVKLVHVKLQVLSSRAIPGKNNPQVLTVQISEVST